MHCTEYTKTLLFKKWFNIEKWKLIFPNWTQNFLGDVSVQFGSFNG